MESSVTDDAIFFDDNFQNLKVADLKKELKSRGLSTTGTKGELRMRLMKDATPKDDKEVLESKLDDSHDSEDDVLTKLETESSSLPRIDKSEDEILGNVPEPAISVIVQPTPEVADETKPLKKRIIVSPSNGILSTEKKLTLNRNSTFVTPPQPGTENVQPSSPKLSTEPEDNSEEAVKKTTVCLKTMTANEKLAMRAKRFNVESMSPSSINTSKSSALKGAATKGPELDLLKKRAERFGMNVSGVMKQIEEREKVLKRKMKFGVSSLSSTTDVSEKKKQRAERFNL